MKKHYRKENNCLNCETILEGRFCHNCGQENLEMRESFGHMMSHAISDYFHFDDQFFHTLKPLLFKPGKLTNEYMAGHRAHYLHPVKMYIFISLIYFLLLFQSGFEPVKVNDTDNKKETKKELIRSNQGLQEALKSPYVPSAARSEMLRQINSNNQAIKKLPYDTSKVDTDNKDSTKNNIVHTRIYGVNVDQYKNYQQYLDKQKKLPEEERDGLLTRMFTKKMIYYYQKYGANAKEMFLDEFKHNIPKMMFLILPLFALILKITFWRNKKYYVEHMIYSFHFHCFLFLFLTFIMLLQIIIPSSWDIMGWIDGAATLYIMWYIYRSLRVVYHRSRFRTITKIIGMSFAYFFVSMFCMGIALFITAVFMPMPSE